MNEEVLRMLQFEYKVNKLKQQIKMTKQLLEVKREIQTKPEAKGKAVYRRHGMSWPGLANVLSRLVSYLYTRAKIYTL